MNQNNPQLDRLEKIISLVDETYVKPEEVVTMFETVVKAIQDTRVGLEQKISVGDESLANECEKIHYELKDMELRVENMITQAKQSGMADIKALASRLNDDIGRVRSLIPTLPDLSYIDRELSRIEAKIPKLPKPVELDNGEQIVNKINSLPTSDNKFKIDASHIKNLPVQNQNGQIHTSGSGIREIIAGSNITVDMTNLQYPVISSTGGGGGGSGYQTPIGTVNGSNTSFTFATAPNVIVVDFVIMRKTESVSGTTNWTGTTTVSMTTAPTDHIYAIG